MSARIIFLFLLVNLYAVSAQEILPDETDAAIRAIKTFSIPSGMKMDSFAAAPQVQSPIAICLDEQGRVYAVEEYRFNRGTAENRSQAFMLEDDLQIDSLEGRLAMFKKHANKLPGGMDWFTNTSDQVRILEDRDGDGRADMSKIFAGGFNDVLDGLAAGVIARDGDVYLTNIPHLWLLKDTDGDNVADVRKPLHRGFGVNAGFLGHDLHGLVWGPDGKLYFSVGDRGFNVTTHEGKKLYGPRRGAVFRCDPDGANLKVIHIGLRNPQELAFDEFGNLFAADNNCDKGDLSRLVYVVEGGDSGWNMAFQTIPDPYLTGPWHAEKMWYVSAPNQPAWILPPVGALGAGPSGFTYYPGVGLDKRYDGHFFMCNYTGNGGIDSFAVKPKGAAFEIVDDHHFLTPIKATDVEFGYDGKMYIADFVNLDWSGKSLGGRIYTLFHTDFPKSDTAKSVATLIRKISTRDVIGQQLLDNLSHPDMRVRLRSQFELARRGAKSIRPLAAILNQKDQSDRAKRHAIWALGQIARKNIEALKPIRKMLSARNYDHREQAVRVLGDARDKGSADALLDLLQNTVTPRLDFFATMALGKLKEERAIEPIFQMLREYRNNDPYIRHAAVMALDRIADPEALLDRYDDRTNAERTAIVLVLRRRKSKDLARVFSDDRIQVEAARAIYDLPIQNGMVELADFLRLADGDLDSEALIRRSINANYRLGKVHNVSLVANAVANPTLSEAMRREAVSCLANWADPPPRDRVTGEWRPLEPRDAQMVQEVIELGKLTLLNANGEALTDVLRLFKQFKIKADIFATNARTPRNQSLPKRRIPFEERRDSTKVEVLKWIVETDPQEAQLLVSEFLESRSSTLRIAAREQLVKLDASAAWLELFAVMQKRNLSAREFQASVRLLGAFDKAEADQLIVEALELLTERPNLAGRWRHLYFSELDLVDVAQQQKTDAIMKSLERYRAKQSKVANVDPLISYRSAVLGGDAARGEELFRLHRQAQCLRCHKVRGFGGTAGPDLSRVASRGNRDFLLQSIIDPDAKLAKGFATVSVITNRGLVISGVIESENDEQLVSKKPDGKSITVKTAEIDERTSSKSAMPDVVRILTPHDIRDLVEYLSTLK